MQRIGEEQARELLTAIFKNNAFIICEYVVETDTFVIYDEEMNARKMIPNYLEYLEQDSIIHPQDRQKVTIIFTLLFLFIRFFFKWAWRRDYPGTPPRGLHNYL